MAIVYADSVTNDTQGFDRYTNSGNSGTGSGLSSDATSLSGSVRSGKFDTGSSGTGYAYARVQDNAAVLTMAADAGRRVSFWFQINQNTSTVADVFALINSAGTDHAFTVGFNASSKLMVANAVGASGGVGGTVVGTGSTNVSTGTAHRLSFSYTITSSSVNTIKVWLDGVLEITVTNTTLTTGYNKFDFGYPQWHGAASANSFINIAHIVIDDGTGLDDIGDVRVAVKRPFANGTTNGFTGSGTPSGYGSGNARYVNERPLATGNFVSKVGAGVATTEEYTADALSAGDQDLTGATINNIFGWVYAKSLASESPSIIIAGSNFGITLTSSNQWLSRRSDLTTYAGNTDIGLVTDTSVTTVTLYECGLLIVYTPPATTTRLLLTLGVGT